MNYKIVDGKKLKALQSEDCNYVFNKVNGTMMTWGKTMDDDPEYSKVGPFIADIEVTTICHGINGVVCPFCYKSNTPNGKYMSFEKFKEVFDCIFKTKVLTQIAFGTDSQAKGNPDLWKIMDYTRENGVIPNITVAQIDQETANELAKRCGAVAVSHYHDNEACYNSIQYLHNAGMKQINIHQLISKETYPSVMRLLQDMKTDERLKHVRAIVFLSLKTKGRGEVFHRMPDEQFEEIVKFCIDNNIGYGFDSCGAVKFMLVAKKLGIDAKVKDLIEPCESSLFSTYINTEGDFYPCSFAEKTDAFPVGIRVGEGVDFLKDVWFNERTVAFRKKLIANKCSTTGCRMCPIYNV